MSGELATIEGEITDTVPHVELAITTAPAEILEQARLAAKALTDVIKGKAKPVRFNGETYIEFEDWQTVGRFYGVTVMVTDVQPTEIRGATGFRATAQAIRDGKPISTAIAMCLNDEPNWKSKPQFQLMSMAQTRACAKALRNVLAWVVVLAGYKPTPAEELPQREERIPTPTSEEVATARARIGQPLNEIDGLTQSVIIDAAKRGGAVAREVTQAFLVEKGYASWGDFIQYGAADAQELLTRLEPPALASSNGSTEPRTVVEQAELLKPVGGAKR